MEERIIKDVNDLLTQLFQKMKEAGYEWDAEKKELKKIEQESAWSEEDEEIHRKCICTMRASACGFPEEEKFVEQVDTWLKSLKDRYTWKPSDEYKEAIQLVYDEKLIPFKDGNQWCFLLGGDIQSGICGFGNTILDAAVEFYKEYDSYKGKIDEIQRPQNQWRPSDLPHWKKSTLPNDNTTGFNSDCFCYKGYNINYKELFEKLPKDD